jgi:hypothetical protein
MSTENLLPKWEWLSEEGATELIRSRKGGSVGRSQKMLGDAQASGEVRNDYDYRSFSLTDDGILDTFNPATAKPRVYSKDDLIDWLDRNLPQEQTPIEAHRYVSDGDLVAEGIAGIKNGRWDNPHQAALDLSLRAKRHSGDAKIDRLRRKIRKHQLGEFSKNPQKSPKPQPRPSRR